MNFKKLILSFLVASLSVASFQTSAEPVTANSAREIANGFVKSHAKATPGSLRAPAMADIMLAYAQPSSKLPKANLYYIFNIKGGGFVIVSGEDHAIPVLGYSDKGQIDVVNMPEQLNALLEMYREDIEYLLTHKVNIPKTFNQKLTEATPIVEPMMKTSWGYQEPYNNLCPALKGVRSKTGCSAVAMAQTFFFWQFPLSSDSLPAYYASRLGDTVPALPPTVFKYDKMLPSYSHWDTESQQLIQDSYTEEEAYEVAKLLRYSGHFVMMNYSPVRSGPQTNRPAAIRNLGYSANAQTIRRKSYTDEKWLQLLHAELDAGNPVMYTAYNQGSDVGHVFMLDGYDSEDYFHMNFGWFGHGDGWYQISAITPTYVDETPRNYIGNNSFIKNLEPPLFCTINADVTANNGLMLLGGTFTPQAVGVKLSMTYRTLPFMFSLTDGQGNLVAVSEPMTLNRLTFENGTDISLPLTLPEILPEGTYNLHLNYRTSDSEPLTQAITAEGQFYVVGRFAKFGSPFGIDDVVVAIDTLINETSGSDITISDVTLLIDHLLK